MPGFRSTPRLPASSVPEKAALLLPAPPSAALVPAMPIGERSLRRRVRASGQAPAWVVRLLSAAVILLAFMVVWQRLPARLDAEPNVGLASAEPVRMKPSPMAPAASNDPPYPFAQFLEVTGLRVVVDLNHRSQVQYLVVNHSATQLADIGLKVAVRSAVAAPGADLLFTVSARVPLLGAHESKEIRTDLDSQLRSTAIPDWGNLRTDVQVTSQP